MDLADELARFRREHPPLERDAGGLAWRYHAAGPGPRALVLLPGYFVGPESWFRVLPGLADELRAIAPEYPRARSVAELARGLDALLESEGVRELVLVGHSVGGLYVQALATRLAASVRGLVLSHSSAPGSLDPRRVRRGNRLGRLVPTWVHRRQWRARIAAERAGDDRATRFWRETYRARAAALDKADLVAWGACLLDLAALAGGARFAGPVLVVDAEDDPVIDVAARVALRARFPDSEVASFAETGHWTPELDPDGFRAAVARFAGRAFR